MKALILNSGMGTRLGDLTRDKPKGLLEIGGGYTLLGRQLELLSQLGVTQAVITTGPFASLLEGYVRGLELPMDITFVPNEDYARTNYIQSMHLAAPLLMVMKRCCQPRGIWCFEESAYYGICS